MTYLLSLLTLTVASIGCISPQSKINSTADFAEVMTMEYPSAFEDDPEIISEETDSTSDSFSDTKVQTESHELEINRFNDDIQPYSFDHTIWNEILRNYVTESGLVNYKGLLSDRVQLDTYIDLLKKNLPQDDWSRNEKLAYWMNAYNALTVDLILKNYPLNSIQDIKDPWKQRLWGLGSEDYNLDEIEHKILRKMDEPRIHFGIVCASFSCPKLLNEAFTADNVDELLTKATKEFLADPNRNTITASKVELSKIFQWFAADFKKDGTIIDFINKYTEVSIDPKAKKRFKTYDWKLNE